MKEAYDMRSRPIMYISQPDIKAPQAKMQQEYHSSEQKTKPQPKPKAKRSKPRRTLRDFPKTDGIEAEVETSKNDIQTNEEDTEVNAASESVVADNTQEKNRKFEDMSQLEKVEYLSRSSRFLPKLTCQLIVAGEKHQGKIIKFEDNQVTLEANTVPRIRKFMLDTIEEIKLTGFDR